MPVLSLQTVCSSHVFMVSPHFPTYMVPQDTFHWVHPSFQPWTFTTQLWNQEWVHSLTPSWKMGKWTSGGVASDPEDTSTLAGWERTAWVGKHWMNEEDSPAWSGDQDWILCPMEEGSPGSWRTDACKSGREHAPERVSFDQLPLWSLPAKRKTIRKSLCHLKLHSSRGNSHSNDRDRIAFYP
jgi:hypothetical protein